MAIDGGLLYDDGAKLLVIQLVITVFAMAWSALCTLGVGMAIKATIGWRIDAEDELEGIDFIEHGEAAYDFGSAVAARRGHGHLLVKEAASEGVRA